jgi:cell division protein FtsX
MLQKINARWVGVGAFLSAALTAGVAQAVPTYDISPVTTGVSSELASNLPTILTVVGALVALGIAFKALRKFAKV